MPIDQHSSSDSSEIWGDVKARIGSEYTIIKEVHSSEFFRILVATRYGRKVLIKALSEKSRNSLKYQEFLHKEFDILVSLNHDSVVKVYSIEEIDEYGLCIIEEYVDGVTLEQYLQKSHTKKEKLQVLIEILKTVDYIHGRGIIHRDIKPSNIIVLHDGWHIKLIDFGLADSSAYEVLKQSCGTEGYVSEEQRAGVNDARNDIYSIGCIIRDMHLGWQYQGIINRCLSQIDKRPASIKAVLAQITRRGKYRTFALSITALLLVIIMGIIYWYARQDNEPVTTPAIQEPAVQHDTVKQIAAPATIQPMATQPASNTSKSYDAILAGAKKMINRDVKPINAMMDTVSRIEYIPSSYYSFLESESDKLNKFAENHRGEISPSEYDTFYNQLMSYYKTKTDRWKRKMEALNAH